MGDNATAQQAPDTGASDQGQETQTPALDFGEVLRSQNEALQKTGQTVEQLRRDLGESHGVIDRVKKAFVGKEEPEQTPFQQRTQAYKDLEAYIDQEALENQKQGGRGLPITTKIGKQLAQLGVESERRAEAAEKKLAEIEQKIKRQENPAHQGLERAAFIMEGMIDEALEKMYGVETSSRPVRAQQFNAVTARINDEIKDLMKNDPDSLLKLQRNPKYMRNMVNQFMAEMLPPRVRTMLEDERIKSEPMGVNELYTAFNEARHNFNEAAAKGDDSTAEGWSRMMDTIRQDILAEQYGGKRDAEKPSLNQLFLSGRR